MKPYLYIKEDKDLKRNVLKLSVNWSGDGCNDVFKGLSTRL